MSFLSHGSSNHNHLSRKIGKKHNSLHTVTQTEGHHADSDTQRPRPFAPIQFDKDSPAPTNSFSKSIFKL